MTDSENHAPGASENRPRKRLKRTDREKMIVEEAIRFFAEAGFAGQTRELARRLDVTQPLLFQYFPTKDDLIERVYQEVYAGRWKPEWEDMLSDRTRPLRDRLETFYADYLRSILTPEWIRIFIHSGLAGGRLHRRYLALVRKHILRRICIELRVEQAMPPPETLALSDRELELAWRLHGGFFYVGMRRWIYGLETPEDLDEVVRDGVAQFLSGAGSVLSTIHAAEAARGEA